MWLSEVETTIIEFFVNLQDFKIANSMIKEMKYIPGKKHRINH